VRTLLAVAAFTAVLAAPAQAAPGDLDLTFSHDGRQLTDFGGDDHANAVAIQADGRIVAAGTRDGDFALARYHRDGSLDLTQTTDLGGSDMAWAIAVQPDGGIVAAGTTEFDVALVRYDADGSLDAGFSEDGIQVTDFGGMDGATGMVLQADGRIVVAGWSDGDFALARYNPDGSPDPTFSGDGMLMTDVGGHDEAAAVAIQPDGRIVAAGGSATDFALARFHPDGSPDTTFAGDGTQHTDFGGGESVRALAIQPDGRIVAAGATNDADWTDFALARYHADGSLDTSFGTGGTQTTDIHYEDAVRGVALLPDGKILAAGRAAHDFMIARSDFGLARYSADGVLDTGFSGDGLVTTDFTLDREDADDAAGAVALESDGRIVVAGSSTAGEPGDFALARYEGGAATGAAPAGTAPPSISGAAVEGQTLTVNPGTWSGTAPLALGHRWRRCDEAGASCVDIVTGPTYTMTAADVGRTIRVRETATNAYGAGTADSAPTAVVAARLGAIAGRVRRAGNGHAIAGATVTCGGRSAMTSGDGRYSIPNVAHGGYSCTAGAKGYAPSTRTVTVTAGTVTTADFNLVRR
jgi:uncharacterized delta-60 repeat protein